MNEELIYSISLIIVAVIEACSAMERRQDKKLRERTETRAEARAKESQLAMQMMDASLELGIATALAVETGKVDGEIAAARKKAQQAQDKYGAFIQELAAHQVVKV